MQSHDYLMMSTHKNYIFQSHKRSFFYQFNFNNFLLYQGTHSNGEVVVLAVQVQHFLAANEDLTLVVAGAVYIVLRAVIFLERSCHAFKACRTRLLYLKSAFSHFVHVTIKQQLTVSGKF